MYLFFKLRIIIVILKFIIVKYMNIQCPNCETIFALPQKHESNKKYKCSVCNHIWVGSTNNYEPTKKTNLTEDSNLKKILILNVSIFLLVILILIIFRSYLENVDNNWKSLYLFFDILIPVQ